MEMPLYRKVIDEVAGFREPVRSKPIELFHFGESLLHPKIDEMVGYASKLGLNTVLSVNAPQLTPQMAHRLLARNPFRLIVSLDGHDAATYRALRGPRADYASAVRNLQAVPGIMAEIGCDTKVCVRMIRMHANAAQEEDFVRDWRNLGLDVEIRQFFPWTESEMADLGEVQKYPPGMPCPFPWEYLVVQWDGTVVPCCRDYNGVNAVGNVRDKTLEEIWNGPGYRAFRNQHRTGDYGANSFCRGCMDIFFTEPEESDVHTGLAPDDTHTLDRLFRSACATHAARPLMIDAADGGTYSHDDVAGLVDRVAGRLQEAGVGRHDRVVSCSAQHVEAALLFWAAMRLGAVFVPLDPHLPAASLASILDEVTPRMVFCDAEAGRRLDATQTPVIYDGSDTDVVFGARGDFFSDWIGDDTTVTVESPATPDCPAVILFTSGTSGRPKGVVLNHGAVFRSGAHMARSYAWKEDDLLWSLGDFHTMSGFRNPLVASLHAGSAFLLAPPGTRANALLVGAESSRHHVTILSTVPALLRQCVKAADRLGPESFSSLRCVLCTGSVLTPEIEESFRGAYGIPVYNYYGLTETSGLCLGILPGRKAEPGSIGWPVGCELMVSSNDLAPVPDGVPGDLMLRSHNLMTGYYHMLPQGPPLRDGWFATGDIACRNADGSITLLGRRGEAIKDARGELLHPDEIERLLELDPRIAEAGVCRIRKGDGEECFAAFLTLNDAPDDETGLVNELRRRVFDTLGPTRVPAYFRFIDALPRGTNSKLLRNKLTEIFSAEERHA